MSAEVATFEAAAQVEPVSVPPPAKKKKTLTRPSVRPGPPARAAVVAPAEPAVGAEPAAAKRPHRFRPGVRAMIRCRALQRSGVPILPMATLNRVLGGRMSEILDKQRSMGRAAGGDAAMTSHGFVLNVTPLAALRDDTPYVAADALMALRTAVESRADELLRAVAIQVTARGARQAGSEDLYAALRVQGEESDAKAILHLMKEPEKYDMSYTGVRSRKRVRE